MTSVSVSKTVRSRAPSVPFSDIASDILPNKYELSVVLIGDALGRKLNKEYKGHDYPTNVLSYPLSKDSGELFINVRKAAREAHKFHDLEVGPTRAGTASKSLTNRHVAYLLIHGCLHLAGYTHGGTMDKLEQKHLRKFTKFKS